MTLNINRHGARRGDPATSHAVVHTRALTWDKSGAARALAIYNDYQTPDGLTYWEAQLIAQTRHPDKHGLGNNWWKRCGELHTEFNDPLIAPVCTPAGDIVTRAGRFGDQVGAYRITNAGIYAYWKMRSQQAGI